MIDFFNLTIKYVCFFLTITIEWFGIRWSEKIKIENKKQSENKRKTVLINKKEIKQSTIRKPELFPLLLPDTIVLQQLFKYFQICSPCFCFEF